MDRSMVLQVLQSKKMAELQQLAREANVATSNKKDTQIAILLEAYPQDQPRVKREAKQEVLPVYPTGEEVLNAVEQYTRKGMIALINEDEKTWQFRVVNGSAISEDSGTLKQPLSIILMKAGTVMQARRPVFHKTGDFAGAMA